MLTAFAAALALAATAAAENPVVPPGPPAGSYCFFGDPPHAGVSAIRGPVYAEVWVCESSGTALPVLELRSPEFPAGEGGSTYALEGGSYALKGISFCDTLEEKLRHARPPAGAGRLRPPEPRPSARERERLDEAGEKEGVALKLCSNCRAQRAAADKFRLKGDTRDLRMSENLYNMANALEKMAEELYGRAQTLRGNKAGAPGEKAP